MKLLHILLFTVLLTAVAFAQRMSVAQLNSFIESSGQLKQDDKKVAGYLKNVKLTERMSEDDLTTMLSHGVGQKTAEALRDLFEASKQLKPPPPPPPKPVTKLPDPPSPEEQRKLIEDLRDYAINYTKRLPDFICTQVIRRYDDPTGLEFWRRRDVITVRLSYFEQKEDYKVMLMNGAPTEVGLERVDGSISTGEFGSMLREVFEPASETEFHWSRWATLGGRRMHVIDYRVRQPKSKWSVSYERSQQITPGYHGLIYVDRDSRAISRLTLEAEDIPPSFPVQQAGTILDYDFVNIGGSDYMLPLKYTVKMRAAKYLAKNETEFRMYRKFGADTAITFDIPEALPEEGRKEEPPKPQ
ncbi:MAG TPA: hypothetical protein VFB63_25145 [Bryobacteraceae bacterium]|nr:hypothetical protein [Bryobacteraceae bacterium]